MSAELPEGFEKNVIGYCDPLSVRPGDEIGFKLSSYTPGPAQVCVVKLISGDDRPHGTGLIEEPVECDIAGSVDLVSQPLKPGSYAHIEGMPPVGHGEFTIWVYPTLVGYDPQTIAPDGARLVESPTAVPTVGGGLGWALDTDSEAGHALPNMEKELRPRGRSPGSYFRSDSWIR